VAFRSNDYGVNGYCRWPRCIPVNEDVIIHVDSVRIYE